MDLQYLSKGNIGGGQNIRVRIKRDEIISALFLTSHLDFKGERLWRSHVEAKRENACRAA
jgi:hypothetical protein